MKKLIIAAVILIGAITTSSAQSERLFIKFGTKSHPACDDCCESGGGICLIIRAEKVSTPKLITSEKKYGVGEWEVTGLNQLKINMVSNSAPFNLNENPNEFLVNKDYTVSSEIAKEFGFSSLVIKQGIYKIDYSTNKLGVVLVNIATR
jgi:hypothetical protein